MKVKYYTKVHDNGWVDFWKRVRGRTFWYDYHEDHSGRWIEVCASAGYMKRTTTEISYNEFILGIM
jgi:hypothetical protein